MYLSKNNHIQQFVKFMISSVLHTHLHNLSRPESVQELVEFLSLLFSCIANQKKL